MSASAATTPRKSPGPPPVGFRGVYTQPKPKPPPPPPLGGSARLAPPPPASFKKKQSVVKNLNFSLHQEEKKEDKSGSLDGLKSFLELVSKSTNKKKSKKLIEPRYGGLDETGA